MGIPRFQMIFFVLVCQCVRGPSSSKNVSSTYSVGRSTSSRICQELHHMQLIIQNVGTCTFEVEVSMILGSRSPSN